MTTAKVRIERQGAITTVILNRPEVRNAVDNETAEAMADAFRAFDADPLPSRQSQMDVIASSRPAAALARLSASQPAMRVSPMRRTSSGPAICPAAKPVVMRASSGVGFVGMRSRAS